LSGLCALAYKAAGWLREIMVFRLLFLILLSGWLASAHAQSAGRYTFAWPIETDQPAPRGGTSRGAPVTLDTAASAQWQVLQSAGLSQFERDRHAILAMAGTYRSTFDFLEVLDFGSSAASQLPYQSWGTEKVYVDSDTGRSISLVHILEMRIQKQDGSISEPMVTKHWRQDWQYEPEAIVEYRGNATWQRRLLSSSEGKGRWLQTVYQVDESPRYASLGTWQHEMTFSSWISAETWRPLPRREWSVRKDYDLLIGSNRHTITATGWVQEENNLKARLASSLQPAYIAREYGVARYQRIKDFSFAAADDYYDKTRGFWNEVRDEWRNWFARDTTVKLRGHVDQLQMYEPLFAQAGKLASAEPAGLTDPATRQRAIRDALTAMRPTP
jgi:hypothetical protein